MNCKIKKIIFLLSGEYYFFWATGITAGVYTAGSFDSINIYLTIVEIIAVILLLAGEAAIVKKIISDNNAPGNSRGFFVENKIDKDCRFNLENIPLSGYENYSRRIMVTIIIPFLILFFVGNLIIYTHKLKEDKSIFLDIYKNEYYAGCGGSSAIIVEGRVAGHPVKNYKKINFMLSADKVYISGDSDQPDRVLNAGEIVNVELKNATGGPIARDDYLRIKGYLKRNNLKESDYGSYNRKEMVLVTYYNHTLKVDNDSPWHKIFIFRSRLYNCLKNAFYRYLDYNNACIAESVILGNRNNVPDYIMESFKKCGLYHLFAISGLHLSFFASFIYLIFRRMERSGIIFRAVIVFLAVYNFLVVERASILRASITVIFVLFARRWHREHSHKIILYLSYIILIIYNPYFFYDIGFWMTYISMAALVFIYPLMAGITESIPVLKKRVINFFLRIILINLSIQTVLFPVLAYFFREISLISPLANFLILPLFYFLLSVLVASSFAIVIWPPLGGLILKLSQFIFKCILSPVRVLGKFNFCIAGFDNFTVKKVIAYYAVFIIILIIARAALDKINELKGKF